MTIIIIRLKACHWVSSTVRQLMGVFKRKWNILCIYSTFLFGWLALHNNIFSLQSLCTVIVPLYIDNAATSHSVHSFQTNSIIMTILLVLYIWWHNIIVFPFVCTCIIINVESKKNTVRQTITVLYTSGQCWGNPWWASKEANM